MERFDLATWELAPDSPEKLEGVAQARVRADWLGEEREFLLREVEVTKDLRIVFLRERESGDAGNWAFCNHSSWSKKSNSLSRIRHRLQPFEGKTLTFLNELYRVIHLSFLPGRTLTVKPSGEVSFESYEQRRRPTRFRLSRSGLERETASYCVELLQREFNTPDSRGQFALHWEQLNFEERADFLVRCHQGSYSQMRRLLRDVLVHAVQPNADFKECSWVCHINPKLDAHSNIWLRNSSPREQEFAETPHLCNWRRALIAWFAPQFIQTLAPEHQSAWIWRDQIRDWSLCTVSTEIPTQHERLEAALRLRDWARGKVPDELLETLT